MSLKAINKVDTNRVELEVAVDPEAFEAAVSKAYKKNIQRMNVPRLPKGQGPPSSGRKDVRHRRVL